MDCHVDLIRNDWDHDQQVAVARIYVDGDGFGMIVKDTVGEHWEGNINDTVGDAVRRSASEIVEVLQKRFHGPYLVASDLHKDGECPFSHGPLSIQRNKVEGRFVLPDISATAG